MEVAAVVVKAREHLALSATTARQLANSKKAKTSKLANCNGITANKGTKTGKTQ